MKKKNYDEVSVIKSITKKADVSVDYANKIVQVKKDSNEVGNGTGEKQIIFVIIVDIVILYLKLLIVIEKLLIENLVMIMIEKLLKKKENNLNLIWLSLLKN